MAYFLLYGAFAPWVLFDGLSRKMGSSAVLWTIGTLILGPITLPIYLALRPLKQGEVREGGTAWNVLKKLRHPMDSGLTTVTFEVSGLKEKFAQVQAVCGVTL